MSAPVVSVIVPVYNAAKFIDACIGSLLEQSFSDFELLLVNDGSKDDSLKICRRYAEGDYRIRVLDKPNGGVSSGRNMGRDNARGQWIAFVDSDDRVTSSYLSRLVEARRQAPDGVGTLVIAGFQAVDAQGGAVLSISAHADRVYFDEAIASALVDNQLVRYGYIASKVYDRQLIERLSLRFDPTLRFSEDLVFMLSYLRHAQCLITSSQCDYLYSRDTNGLSTAYSDFESEYRFLCAMKDGVSAIVGKDCDAPSYIRYHSMMSLRVISCLYRPKTRLNRKDRIIALKRFAIEHEQLLSLSTSYRLRLLHKARYWLFDGMTAAAYSLRFSPLRHLWQLYLRRNSTQRNDL